MNLPAELRIRIYEYAFTDLVEDEMGLYVAKVATPVEGGVQAEVLPPTPAVKQPRQINLLESEKHYPQAKLLVACKQIYQEAEPIFEKAVNDFWDIDYFNIDAHHSPPDVRGAQAKVKQMPMLQAIGVKGIRVSWDDCRLTVTYDDRGGFLMATTDTQGFLSRADDVFIKHKKARMTRWDHSNREGFLNIDGLLHLLHLLYG